MASLSSYLETGILNHVTGGTPLPQPTSIFLALFTSPTDDGSGGTEVSGGSYARQEISWNPASGNLVTNNGLFSFPVATASWGKVTYIALHDAVTGGNRLWQGPITNFKNIFVGFHPSDEIISVGNVLANGDEVILKGSNLPAPLIADTTYYVIEKGLINPDGFKLSETFNGSAINITAQGDGIIYRSIPRYVMTNDTFTVPDATLQLTLD